MRPVLLLCALSACSPQRGGSADEFENDLERVARHTDLLITEVMADPSDCPDSSGEWIELTNLSRDTVILDGLTLRDADGNLGSITAAEPLAPHGIVVVGRGNADTFCGPTAGAYMSGPTLNNTGESLTLMSGGVEIDSTPMFTDIDAGQSLQLHPSFVYGASDLSAWTTASSCLTERQNTPGTENSDCITEEMTGFAVADAPTPVTEVQKHAVLSSSRAWLDGDLHTVGFQPLLRTGDVRGDLPFGTLTDEHGEIVHAADGSAFVSAYADFTSLLDQGDDGIWAVTQFEEHPGAMYLTELERSGDLLQAVSTEPVDFSSIGGLWTPCAGSVTPWGTHLGSEEYPSDAREFEQVAVVSDLENRAFEYIRYYGFDVFTDNDDDGEPDHAALTDVLSRYSPYRHGFAVEVTVQSGTTSVERHYAMGRRSLELARVMPDQRTVYLTDDGTNVGFYMFLADQAGDLSAGRLYAMRWDQTGTLPPSADVAWVDLGWADSAQVKDAVDDGIRFSDLFSAAEPEDGFCPSGFTSLNAGEGHECLTVQTGMEVLASRLESRRYAAYLGATTEFRKEEGLTHDPATNTLYVSMSAIEKGMSDDFRSDETGGPNHVRLPYNPCGAVFALSLGSDEAVGSDFVAQDIVAVVEGRSASYADSSRYVRNTCNVNSISNPDNLTFIEDRNTLIIGEDTFRHVNDAVWAMDVGTGRLDRVLTTPYGAEATAVAWHEDVRGIGLLMAVAQHPYGESDRSQLQDPADAAGWLGYWGPFVR